MVAQNITPVKQNVASDMYRHARANKDVHAFSLVMIAVIVATGLVTQSPFVYFGFPIILLAGIIAGTWCVVKKGSDDSRP